jgi:hypothetical protein
MPRPKSTGSSSLLECEDFWRLLLTRLSGGTDAIHDAAVLIDLHNELGIHPRDVLARIRTYVHGAPGRLH